MKKTIALFTMLLLIASLLMGCGGTDKRIYGEWEDSTQTSGFGFGTDFKGYMKQSGFSLPIVYKFEKNILTIAFGEELTELEETEEDKLLIYGVTFFGDSEFVLEIPPESGNAYTYKRKTQQ